MVLWLSIGFSRYGSGRGGGDSAGGGKGGTEKGEAWLSLNPALAQLPVLVYPRVLRKMVIVFTGPWFPASASCWGPPTFIFHHLKAITRFFSRAAATGSLGGRHKLAWVGAGPQEARIDDYICMRLAPMYSVQNAWNLLTPQVLDGSRDQMFFYFVIWFGVVLFFIYVNVYIYIWVYMYINYSLRFTIGICS